MGGSAVAGHAPEFLSPSDRLLRWLVNLSDLRLSLYMLALAATTAATLLVIDRQFFG